MLRLYQTLATKLYITAAACFVLSNQPWLLVFRLTMQNAQGFSCAIRAQAFRRTTDVPTRLFASVCLVRRFCSRTSSLDGSAGGAAGTGRDYQRRSDLPKRSRALQGPQCTGT